MKKFDLIIIGGGARIFHKLFYGFVCLYSLARTSSWRAERRASARRKALHSPHKISGRRFAPPTKKSESLVLALYSENSSNAFRRRRRRRGNPPAKSRKCGGAAPLTISSFLWRQILFEKKTAHNSIVIV